MLRDQRRKELLAVSCSLVVLLISPSVARAADGETELKILSGPELIPAPNAPLARVLELTTNVPSRVEVWATSQAETWERQFYAYQEVHSLALVGFKADRNYEIRITLYDLAGNSLEVADPLVFLTAPLPDGFPPIEVLVSEPHLMEPGYTLLSPWDRNSGGPRYLLIVDNTGETVWYSPGSAGDVRQLANGNLLFLNTSESNVVELNLLGEAERIWHPSLSGTPPPAGSIPVESTSFHHEVFPTEHGTILSLLYETRTVDDYPTSDTDPSAPPATAEVEDNPVIEFSMVTGEIINEWSLHDMLDPTRIGYLSLSSRGAANGAFDWGHANAVIHDPSDDSIIVSIRHQDAVVKFSRATGELIWILGPHENWKPLFMPYLLTPDGTPFEWQYHQHTPMVTPQGTLLLFDNGNFRASPFHQPPVADEDNYSRAVEYRIHEDTMEVAQAWEYGTDAAERLYARAVSDADWLSSTGNVLVTFGAVTFIDGVPANGAAVRIIEVSHGLPAEKVFELSIAASDPDSRGWRTYRSERINDLYPTRILLDLEADPPSPVQLSKVETVVFTASASGGSGNYDYQFWLRDLSGSWELAQDYGNGDSLVWTPASAGSWRIRARAKNLGSPAVQEASAELRFDVIVDPPVTSVSLSADPPSPAELSAGTVIFTANAFGGTGSYDYLFRLAAPSGAWTVAQDYGNGDTFAWNPAHEGIWRIEVWAKNRGSFALREALAEAPYEILPLFADGFESGDFSAWSATHP